MAVFLVVDLCISVAICLYAIKLAKRGAGAAKICALAIGGAFLSLLLFGIPTLLQSAAMFVGALLSPLPLAYRRWMNRSKLPQEKQVAATAALRRRYLMWLAAAAPVLAYGAVFCWQAVEWRQFVRLRQMYPFESVAKRLAYEHAPRSAANNAPSAAPIESLAVATQLANLEETSQYYRNWRTDMLRLLHEQTAFEFSMAQGFGPSRMIAVEPRAENLLETDSGLIPLDAPENNGPFAAANDGGSVPIEKKPGATTAPARNVLESLHWIGRDDFLNPDRFGYIQDRDHVAGFESHRFTALPVGQNQAWQASWRLARLELIGLMKYDKPKAYVSKYLPRLKELGDAATRDVDAFESQALARLRTQEDVVIDQRSDRIRMVGSLRAGTSCIECHEVRRGELLGALTYEFVPKVAKQAPGQAPSGLTRD